MTDYIAWLLEEEDESEEETEAPAFDWDGAYPLPRRRAAEAAKETETDGAEPFLAAMQEAEAARKAASAEALPAQARQRGDILGDVTAEARAAEVAARTEALARARAFAAGSVTDGSAEGQAAADLYADFSAGRRQAQLAGAPQRSGAIALPETAAEPGEPPGLDIAAIDRCFERDARRYDNRADW